EVVEEEQADIKNARLAPDVIFVGESEEVTFGARIPYDVSSGAPQVSLQRIDTLGNVLSVEGALVDNGDAAQGDLRSGDGLFSFRRVYAAENAEQLRFRVSYQQGGNELKSEALQLGFYHQLTDAQIESIKATQHGAAERYQSLLASAGKDQAIETLLVELRQNPTVLQATVNASHSSISMLYAPGILGGLSLDPPGTRGGGGGTSSASAMVNHPASSFSSVPLQLPVEEDDEEDDRIGNKRALILSPFRDQFAPWDEGEMVSQMLGNSECPTYNVEYYSENVGVNYLWNLDSYGLIVIVTHGDMQETFVHPAFHRLPPNSELVALSMRDDIDAAGVFRLHQKDLFAGRLTIRGTNAEAFFAALPNYIEYYTAGEMPNSMVYVAACHSLNNSSMADAFLGRGTQTYFGYSKAVASDFAFGIALNFMDSFFGPTPHTTGGPEGAFTPGQIDPTTGAEFMMRGSQTLNRPSAEFTNGDFEKGSLNSWGFAFDSRVLGQLGNITPTTGDYMAMVSKSDTWFGWLQQEFCLDTDVTHIEFDWNLITEQQCDQLSAGPDQLWIRLTGDDLYHQLITTDVLQQCGKFGPTTVDLPSDGVAKATGWQHALIDITEVARQMNGKKVQLVFEVRHAVNYGDVEIDSAVLIDNVRVVRENDSLRHSTTNKH
ncbi:MAG TPA: hypothetical protein VMS31_22960, partial [Pyrinomonadaceae bacterium]|nr:hypothetical protein [Pyrinomonadaceae bacterium]